MDIESVARLAKVSTATVSRVINDSPAVRPATAQRVRKVIEQVGYVPNRSARNLRVRHTRLFGLIVSDVRNPFFAELIDGFDAMATAHGIDVIFTHTNYEPERLKHCLRRMVERNVDGIAVLGSEANAAAIASVNRLKIPVVVLDQSANGPACSNILTDFDGGFLEAVRHLKELGHVDIGFIAGPGEFESVKRRQQAFLRAMKRLKLTVHAEWTVTGDLHLEGGIAAMETLLAMKSRPTALVSTNDLMAVGALQAAHRAGLDVPGELSIIGFDDLPISAMVHPALTTISMSRQEIASRAFAALMNAASVTERVIRFEHDIEPTLVVRSSTAAPPADGRVRRRSKG